MREAGAGRKVAPFSSFSDDAKSYLCRKESSSHPSTRTEINAKKETQQPAVSVEHGGGGRGGALLDCLGPCRGQSPERQQVLREETWGVRPV